MTSHKDHRNQLCTNSTLQSDSVSRPHSLPAVNGTPLAEKQPVDEDNQVTATDSREDHLKELEAGMASDKQSDTIIVGWDGPDDPMNPKKLVPFG